MTNTFPAPTPAGYEAANSLDIPFPCRDHAEQEAAHLEAQISHKSFGVREFKGKWYVVQTAWRSPVIVNGKVTHIE